jgi:hypothetical protein
VLARRSNAGSASFDEGNARFGLRRIASFFMFLADAPDARGRRVFAVGSLGVDNKLNKFHSIHFPKSVLCVTRHNT